MRDLIARRTGRAGSSALLRLLGRVLPATGRHRGVLARRRTLLVLPQGLDADRHGFRPRQRYVYNPHAVRLTWKVTFPGLEA
ncbi:MULTISPECIES: hypothetical protein [Streptomyces]|uniref:Uncharacterized protein n=1 Tax=Streptomyces desertarenae TaxID=2666184 RepID=A0ABW4PJM9_9ACTN